MSSSKKTPAVPASTKLRIRVRTRARRPLSGADAKITIGPMTRTAKTGADGFVNFTVTAAELAAANPSGTVVVQAKKHHHGPDGGLGSNIVPGLFLLTATASTSGFDASTPGLAKDAKGSFLDVVLVDGGFRFAVVSSIITCRLKDDELQREIMFDHHSGAITLADASDFVFNHDPSMGEFDPCDPTKCTLKSPKANRRVSLQDSKVGPVTFFALLKFAPSTANKSSDLIPGQRFTRDKFQWGNMPLQTLDQRHLVGLVRMCRTLNAAHSIVAIFTQGVNGDTTRTDCHGYGLAIDFGGLSKELPDPKVKTMPVRLGVDFIVFLHWGNHPMWDSTTVAAAPSTPASWSRLKVNDDGFDYGTDLKGTTHRLHYRMDPAPFQDPVPSTAPAPLSTELVKVASHFTTARAVFRSVYDFAVAEYSDSNTLLGRLPAGTVDTPTPIDSHAGHLILYPDYPHPNTSPSNGRQAHVNHLHFQLGQTHYTTPRST